MTDAPGGAAAWTPLLRIGLAAAACWHLLGNAGVASGVPAVLVGGSAAVVVAAPWSRVAFAAFTVSVWTSIWQEAPILGNHWLLTGLLAAAVCLASLDRRPAAPVTAAQAVLLVFYGFAAFAKLNADFFDPATSCATYYAAEGARSLGWDIARPDGSAGMALAVVVALTELSIPVLLLLRRTRLHGVALAVVFHAVVALDHRHQFYDFTSLLTVGFLTFLPGAAATGFVAAVAARIRPRLVQAAGAVLAVVAGWLAQSDVDVDVPFELGYAAWTATAILVVPLVLRWVWRHRSAAPEHQGRFAWAAAPVVALAVLNGLAPYLELKTGAAWNMYANLRTVDGDSNHFLVRATLPLTDAQEDLVEVVEADGALAGYAEGGVLLPRRQLRWFLQQAPDTTGTIRVDGREIELEPGRIPPELGPEVPDVVGRLAGLRASRPPGEPVLCQDVYLPAT